MSRALAWVRQGALRVVRFEVILLAAVYVYYVISDSLPLPALAGIVLIWAARWWTTGRLTRSTPLDLPIFLILVWLPISLWVSTNWWLSLPKVYGVLLSAVFYYAFINAVNSRRDLYWATLWLVVVFAGVALAGLLGTDWAQDKILSAGFIYDRLPRFIQGIPRSIAGGFARNGVGGTLTLTIPFLASILLGFLPVRREGPDSVTGDEFPVCRSYSTIVVTIALLLSLAALALTQSRGALLGTAIGLLGVAVWRERRAVWVPVSGAAMVAGLFLLGQGNTILDLILRMDAKNGTLASRLEVWQRGVWMVQDFPLTGVGIGTYNDIAHLLYPFFIAGPDEIVAHAHNNLLQVAVDMGIPGLIAYVAFLTVFGLALAKALRSNQDARVRSIAVGAGMGMLAHQIFGLTDAFMLGTKPGVLLWLYSGLAIVLSRWQELENR